MRLIETKEMKIVDSEEFHSVFNKNTGFFARWGKEEKDNPEYSPWGPEILDIEISTICHKGCKFCYKSNVALGKNMSFDTFKTMFATFPKQLTQIAFGIGSIDSNPDLWRIMEHCRTHGVIPNITINGERMTPELYDALESHCGAVAVSLYNKNTCYNAIKELTDRGMTQVNIHALLSRETYRNCLRVLSDRATDPRLAKLNAVVFLWMKPKGERNTFHQLTSMDNFRVLIDAAIETGTNFGFDSCTAPNFLKAVEDNPKFEQFKIMSEPCEATLFSGYISVDAKFFPCSFSEGERYTGVDVVGCKDFLKDVWNGEETKHFRTNVMANKDYNGCRMCPLFNLNLGQK